MVRLIILRLLESFFRRPLLNLAPFAIALILGAGYIFLSPPEYLSSGKIYVEKDSLLASLTSSNTDVSWWVTPAQATANELGELLATNAFVRSAIQQTKLEPLMAGGPEVVWETFTFFRREVSINSLGDKLVEIRATTDDPELSYQLVVATMDTYLKWKLNTDFQESVAAQKFFESLIAPYQAEVDQARQALIDFLSNNPEPVRGERPPSEQFQLDQLRAALERAEERLIAVRENEESARLALVKNESLIRQTYQIIDQPELPQKAEFSLTGFVKNMIIFVAIGVFLSVSLIGGGALLDRSLRFPVDVRHGLNVPLLALVPFNQEVTPPAVVAAAAPEAERPSLQPQEV
ncbi:lipopolysaccharide biosynthesis protein [Chloroflexus sp.]|uniref:lipopolysaccharide biosynthesis protein n=1 Tax=Chloroflexus sp. TaxID=1904827 RepID=UPI002ACDAC79|nr:lipopolysaccharide biosynthesis protein [Chloroflexus sp.]